MDICYVLNKMLLILLVMNLLTNLVFSVTCDSDLPSLDVGGVINHLIHYSLPRDKSSFVRRHTLLLPAISASHFPCLTVFVSDDCLNQSRDLLQLLQRTGQSAPDELNNMAEKRKKVLYMYVTYCNISSFFRLTEATEEIENF